MEFELTEEQAELQRIAREVAARECPASLVRSVVEDGADVDGLWKTIVELEWPGLTVPLDQGGSGAGPVELVVLLQELGRAADPTAFLATTTQHLPLVLALDGAARDERLAAICAGSVGAALLEPEAVSARADGAGWVLDGAVAHVLDGDRADSLAVVARAGGDLAVLLVPADAEGLTVTREPSIDASLHLATVRLEGVRADGARAAVGADAAGAIARAEQVAATGLAATMVGAAQQILDLALVHLRERHQFGVPIGSFQALKHMAVDVYTALERAEAVVHFAALALAGSTPDPARAAAMARAAAGDAQRIAVQHGIQFFGGIGYTWENDLQLFVRRVKASEMLLGGARHHRQVASRRELDRVAAGAPPAVVAFDDATEAFRRELGEWIEANAPAPEETTERSTSSAHVPAWARAWQAKMFDAGWLVPGNPPEFGGRDAGLLQQFVHQEELGRRRIYPSFNPQGLSIITPSILAYGTEEQKRRWAVPIMRAEITAALGMSEPDAGSDLAGLRTRAVLDGDRFVVNGQKVWTSGAHDADVIFAFVRTDPDAPKHKGISVLLIPTDTPGVVRRPFGSIQGRDELDFNEVFFEDAVVPAENLVGELHQGWRVATGSLGHERAMLWLGYAERLDDLIERGGRAILDHGLADDAYALDWYGQLVTDAQALRMLGYRTLAKVARGAEPKEQSILKLFGSEAAQRATLHVLEAIGADALDPTVRTAPIDHLDLDVWTDGWFDLYLRSFSATIAGGTSQIQRNIVAERVLDLPRS